MSDNAQIKPFIDRLVQLETEKRQKSEDIKELMAEAKSVGFLPAAIKLNAVQILKDEAKKQREREIREHAELYAEAYGQGDLFV
jgi:uncharacterized protein (UPF0335 family)